MRWTEAPAFRTNERRVLVATAGLLLLTVVERADGSAYWSCGEGGSALLRECAAEADTVENAMRAALADARRRWQTWGEAIDEIEEM